MQTSEAILAADARLAPLSGWRAALVVAIGGSIMLLFTLALLMTAFVLTSEDGTRALNMDFRVFWAAARLGLAGEALATFDMARLGVEHNVNPDDWMPWLYPPGYLVLILPFGAMSFAVAFTVSTLVSFGLIALTSRPFAAGYTTVWIGMILAPAYLPGLVIGQNSMFWLAGLLAALAALRSERWVLAGIFIGCLTLKPQLGLMIPIALIAAGLWRSIFAAAAAAIVLAALPTFAFGLEYWPLLAERLSEQSERLVYSINDLFLMVGPFFFLTLFGVAPGVAIWAQWMVSAVAAVSLFLLWRSDRVSFDAKAAMLLTAILLSAPYLWYYEVAMMAAIGLFMLRAGILTPWAPHLVLLLLLWLGAGLQSMNIFLDFVDGRSLGAIIITPVLITSLALCLLHYARATRGALDPTPA